MAGSSTEERCHWASDRRASFSPAPSAKPGTTPHYRVSRTHQHDTSSSGASISCVLRFDVLLTIATQVLKALPGKGATSSFAQAAQHLSEGCSYAASLAVAVLRGRLHPEWCRGTHHNHDPCAAVDRLLAGGALDAPTCGALPGDVELPFQTWHYPTARGALLALVHLHGMGYFSASRGDAAYYARRMPTVRLQLLRAAVLGEGDQANFRRRGALKVVCTWLASPTACVPLHAMPGDDIDSLLRLSNCSLWSSTIAAVQASLRHVPPATWQDLVVRRLAPAGNAGQSTLARLIVGVAAHDVLVSAPARWGAGRWVPMCFSLSSTRATRPQSMPC